MESLGCSIVAVGWGALVGALLLCVVTGVVVTRWRRRAIAAPGEAEQGQKGRAPHVPDR
ncbi:hypothetical protein [Streptomyces sp. NBC_00316]|uniref:hypothetical protein n=1 Tax=Streptomyces sp. NBC_00316 TaxID=2975710 RepID=UPI002E2B88DD|nr:hypothetical protein [Streptomyces sp. NBC_00316]